MEDGKFLEFIYFSLFTTLLNFPNELVIDMSEPVLKSRCSLSGNGSMMVVNFEHIAEECFSKNS